VGRGKPEAKILRPFSPRGQESASWYFESAKSRRLENVFDTEGADILGNASTGAPGPAKSISPESSSPTIVVLVGLPGSGKSTYIKHRDGVLSSDEIRRLLADDSEDQTIHARVFAVLRALLKQRIEIGRPVTYIDATNLTRRDRKPYLKMAKLRACAIEAIFFDVPLEVCQERNRRRSRVVPEEVIARMAKRLQPPAIAEGFDRVIVVDSTAFNSTSARATGPD
jgi:predicted kinase